MGEVPDRLHLRRGHETAVSVAEHFLLGEVVENPEPVAAGWALHNVIWRFTTDTGMWAVKELGGREPASHLEAAATLEAQVHRLGIPSPEPVSGRDGHWLVVIEGRAFRCHHWVTGTCPTADLTERDADLAGQALARLHNLRLPWHSNCLKPPYGWGDQHWRNNVERADSAGLHWAPRLAEILDWILDVEAAAVEWASRPHRWVASHRDVRPDNTLRSDGEVLLVDWDSAGPVVPGGEVANVLRWWTPHEDAFLDGYTATAGNVDLREGDGEGGGLVWWLETNVRLALDRPDDSHRQDAVGALLRDLSSGH